MATLAEHTAARNDADLRARFVAAAEMAGISNLEQWVNQRIEDAGGDTKQAEATITAERAVLAQEAIRARALDDA